MGNFTKIDEEFVCENCGAHVPTLGYTCRDHCNKCLYSKHVDKNPGDRLEECHGKLKPIAVYNDPKKGEMIYFKCQKCGMARRNIVAKDDNRRLVIELSGNPLIF